jgi:hypothetical protein
MGCAQSSNATPADQEEQQPKRNAVVAGPAPKASKNISNKLALGAGKLLLRVISMINNPIFENLFDPKNSMQGVIGEQKST